MPALVLHHHSPVSFTKQVTYPSVGVPTLLTSHITWDHINTDCLTSVTMVELMPGTVIDDICLGIFHRPLVPRAEAVKQQVPIESLQKTLPDGWLVKETLDGRYLYMKLGNSGTPNTWDHPDLSANNSHLTVDQDLPPTDYDPVYEALSYVWGPSGDSEIARLASRSDNERFDTTMPIGANLACALRYLRHPDRSRTLWIDAICIDQSLNEEKNAQVKRMAQMYSYAHRVIIWLGKEQDESTHALTTLKYFGEQVEYTADECIGDSPGALEPTWWDAERRLPYDAATSSSLVSLFSRPWFSRVWVLQEALLANQRALVQCGDHSIPWSILRKAMVVLAEKVGLPAELFATLGSYRTGLLTKSTWNLPRLLLWGRFRKCTDDRDKIYGMLSLVSPAVAMNISVDYNMSAGEVYRDALLAHAELTKRLELLRHCQLEHRCTGGPSWVPNFAAERGRFFGFRKGHTRQASGHSAAQIRRPSPNVLEATGVSCATVTSARKVPAGDLNGAFQATQQWKPDGLWTGGYVTGGSTFDGFLEVIAKGRLRDRYPNIPPFPTMHGLRQGLSDAMRGNSSIDNALDYFKEELKVDGTFFFETREGYLGVSQSQPEEGAN